MGQRDIHDSKFYRLLVSTGLPEKTSLLNITTHYKKNTHMGWKPCR